MIQVALCDDAVSFKAMARILLQQEGDIEVVAAFDDGAALRAGLAEGLAADVLLLDLVLPDVPDTAALVAEVRERAPGTRVLLCSGSTAEQVQAAAREAGADGATSKATTGPALRDAVRALAG